MTATRLESWWERPAEIRRATDVISGNRYFANRNYFPTSNSQRRSRNRITRHKMNVALIRRICDWVIIVTNIFCFAAMKTRARPSFVRSLRARVQPTLDPQRWDRYIGRCASPGEEGNWCVRCMCALCRVKEETVGVSSLSGVTKRAPSRHGLYCLAKPGLSLLQRLAGDLATSICFGSHVSATDILTLLIKASATVSL